MKKNQSYAFTLIELLVIITIISILAIWTTQVNFNKIWDKQRLDTVVTKIISNFETVRWNALMWKWIGTNLNVPESYQIDFSTTWSGSITTQYLSWTLQVYNDIVPVDFGDKFNRLSVFRCNTLIDTDPSNHISNSWDVWTVILKWGSLYLTWACNQPSSKILEFDVQRKEFSETIQINTLNGLISIKDN